ncbi:MAG: flavoprotein [Caldiserica bacterium]|jgi:flavoprotein|nr:flavoprotein [Caldisericota bacterium]MDH7562554.1 flavoprotein [Caldisericota bacterium]
MKKIAWAITGGGHFLSECVEILSKAPQIDLFLSKAGEEVLRIYRLEEKALQGRRGIFRDHSASAPIVGRFAKGDYHLLIVAPATSNSIAKFALGIADSLVSNLFSQAGKSRIPIIVLPTDVGEEIDSPAPKGDLVKVYPRKIDLENVKKLEEFSGVTVVKSVEELERCLNTYLLPES